MSANRIEALIDLDNIVRNLEAFKSNINADTRIMAVIKADGYGHGAVRIAKKIEKLDYLYGFCVATAEEAIELRDAWITKPILILGYTFKEDYELLIRNNIILTVFTDEMLNEISETARLLNMNASVHIKVDTGMSRIGIKPDAEGLEFVKRVNKKENISLEGMFTHFARADEYDKTKAYEQLNKYIAFSTKIEDEGISIPIKHCSNSAGIIELREANLNVVRAGITLYGLWPSNEVSKDIIPLYPVMKLISHVSYVKELEPGCEISYGGTYKVESKMKVATVPCGYADGIPRGLSNKGFVLVHGIKAPIVGRVCMDQFMIDVSNIDNVNVRDEVVIIGNQGELNISAEEVGDISGRFNYELVCDISKRVPRTYIE